MRDQPIADLIRDQDPLTLPPETSIRDACARMRDRHVGAVLVTTDDGGLAGIFTGRDAVCRMLAEGLDAARVTLAEAMTPAPDTLPPTATAMDALRLMQDRHCRHVPIVREGRVVGIVSRGDFRALAHARLTEENGFFEVLR